MSSERDLKKTLAFVSFCIEEYKNLHQTDGASAISLFEEYGVLDYLSENYDVLHSFGKDALLRDIEQFIKLRQEQL